MFYYPPRHSFWMLRKFALNSMRSFKRNDVLTIENQLGSCKSQTFLNRLSVIHLRVPNLLSWIPSPPSLPSSPPPFPAPRRSQPTLMMVAAGTTRIALLLESLMICIWHYDRVHSSKTSSKLLIPPLAYIHHIQSYHSTFDFCPCISTWKEFFWSF